MFNGEETVRIRTKLPKGRVVEILEDGLSPLGKVKFSKRGDIRISNRKFQDTFAETIIDGEFEEGRKDGDWNVRIRYTVTPTPVCWVVAVVGFILVLVGPLIFLIPFLAKGELQKKIERALDDAKDEAEGRANRDPDDDDDE